jgi:[acyl-carrier-protein] S-malonyltransferase
METMIDHGVDLFVECGSGTVLAGLAKRIHRDAEVLSVGDPESIEAFLERIG